MSVEEKLLYINTLQVTNGCPREGFKNLQKIHAGRTRKPTPGFWLSKQNACPRGDFVVERGKGRERASE